MTGPSNLARFARPYAQAVFEVAREQDTSAAWDEWEEQLQLLARISEAPTLIQLTAQPRFSAAQLCALVLDVGGARLSQGAKNLVQLLVRNRRFTVMPEIARIFAQKKAAAANILTAKITTAVPMPAATQAKFKQALSAKLSRDNDLRDSVDASIHKPDGQVEIEFAVAPDLIGGAVIRIGDRVMNASVKAQLAELRGALQS